MYLIGKEITQKQIKMIMKLFGLLWAVNFTSMFYPSFWLIPMWFGLIISLFSDKIGEYFTQKQTKPIENPIEEKNEKIHRKELVLMKKRSVITTKSTAMTGFDKYGRKYVSKSKKKDE